MKKSYDIEVDCANCAIEMEDAINKVKGIKEASINFMMKKLDIEFEDGADINQVISEANKTVQKLDDEMKIIL